MRLVGTKVDVFSRYERIEHLDICDSLGLYDNNNRSSKGEFGRCIEHCYG